MNTTRNYGWIPDKKDNRDFRFSSKKVTVELPSKIDLTPNMPPVYDQGNIGSCVFNAIGAGFQYLLPKEKKENFIPSRLFPYYIYREKEGNINEDSGAQIREAIKVYVKEGVCNEQLWPYLITFFAVKPSVRAYTEALNHQVLKYERLPNDLDDLKHCLASGYPFVAGILIYDSFETDSVAKTGIVPMPNAKKENLLGGHAILVVGYDDSTKYFKVRNSWGDTWGDKGYFYLPYDFVLNKKLTSDLWTIQLTE